MPKVQTVSEMNPEQVLKGVAQFDTSTLENFFGQVSHLLARRKAPNVPQREVELLELIGNYLPSGIQSRYKELNNRLHDAIITDLEHREFLALVDQVELADASRLQVLVELAQLRGVSLDALMEQLGLRQPIYAYPN